MSQYRKNLGLLDLISFGVGGTIGSGIFVVLACMGIIKTSIY